MPQVERTMYAYSLHARTREGLVDYLALFASLAERPVVVRQTEVRGETVAITYMEPSGRGWLLRFVAGEEGVPPLYYDPSTGKERFGELRGGLVASANWMFVDPEQRIVVVERRRPGVGVGTMARAIANMARDLELIDSKVSLDLNPIVADSFAAEVDRYERIREAAVVLARPNYNWSDNAAELTRYANDSNADNVEVSMSAKRGESLERSHGIVADIVDLTRRIVGPVKNLRIVGRRQGDTKETTVSLQRHQEKRNFVSASAVSPPQEREAFGHAAESFVEDLEVRDIPE